MTSWLKGWAGWFFVCLAALFLLNLNTKAQALDKTVSSALSHYIMGLNYEGLGNMDKAVEEYKKAALNDSESPLIRLNLASAYVKQNNIPKAIEELKVCTTLDPESVEPRAILALVYYSLNQPELAAVEYEAALKNAVKLQPKNADVYKSLALLYLQQGNLKEAESSYKLITELAPDDAEAHFYLGTVYSELKKSSWGEKEFKKALELKADYAEAMNSLGYMYVEERRNFAEAEKLIRRALEIEPENGAYLDSLGWLYFNKGRHKEALQAIEKASALIVDPVVYDHLGDVYFKMKDIKNARINWEKSFALEPKDNIKSKIEKAK